MDDRFGNGDELSKSLENLKRRLSQDPALASRFPVPVPRPLPPLPAVSAGGRVPDYVAARAAGNLASKLLARRGMLFAGAAAAIHFGLPTGKDAETPIDALAENITRLTDGAGQEAQHGAVQLAEALPGTGFFTDFSEAQPLRHWWQLEREGLKIEPFEKRMSAVPKGPSIVVPTLAMKNGRAYFQYVQQHRDAGVIVRGQNDKDCYRLVFSIQVYHGRPELTFTARRRRRGVERDIARQTVTDLRLASMTRQHVSIEMDGAQFAARLHWVEPGPVPGWPDITKEQIIATWKDDTFTDGAVGVWGPERGSSEGEFRLLTVAAEV